MASIFHPSIGSPRWIFWSIFSAASVLLLVMLGTFWVGFLGSDDVSYWQGSTGWLTHFPYIAKDHWTLRHALVVPIAVMRLIFGDGPHSLFLPTVIYAECVLLVAGLWAWRTGGAASMLVALILLATYPQVVIYSSTADIDIVELSFVFGSFFLLASVIQNEHAASKTAELSQPTRCKLFVAGALIGLGFLSRETAIFALVAMGVLGLSAYKLERKLYLYILAGFISVVGAEVLYFWSQTGNWHYRFSIDFHHDKTINRWEDQGAAIPFLHPALDPITMLLVNHNFGLTAWIAIPLSIWFFRRNDLQPAERNTVVLLGTLALIWAGLAAVLWNKLVLIPRYYMVPAVSTLVIAALAINRMWQDGRRWLPGIVLGLVVASNIISLSLDNRNVMLGERTLVRLAAEHGEQIHTDSQTLHRADLLLRWRGLTRRVTATAPSHGDLLYVNPLRQSGASTPPSNSKLVFERAVPLTGGRWLACNLPTQIVPGSMLGRLSCRPMSLKLYRVES